MTQIMCSVISKILTMIANAAEKTKKYNVSSQKHVVLALNVVRVCQTVWLIALNRK